MCQGLVEHPDAKVLRVTSVRVELEVHGDDLAVLVAAGLVLHPVGSAVSGDREVLHSVEHELHGQTQASRSDGCHRGHKVARALASEATSEALDLDGNLVSRQLEHGGELPLHAVGVLRRGVDVELGVLARHHERRVRLHVKVLLAAERELALDHMVGVREAALNVATLNVVREDGLVERAGGDRVLDRDDGRQRFVLHVDELGRVACDGSRVSDDEADRLSDGTHDIGRKHLFVGERALDVASGHILRRDERYHAWNGESLRGIDREQLAVCDRARHQRGVLASWYLDIGRKLGLASNMRLSTQVQCSMMNNLALAIHRCESE